MNTDEFPSREWFEAQRARFAALWEEVPWQESEVRRLDAIGHKVSRYASHLVRLPESFQNLAYDQYLAAFGAGYPFFCLQVAGSYGDDRHLCRGIDGLDRVVYSKAISTNLASGGRLFITTLVGLQERDDCFLTYGPVLSWKGIDLYDMDYFARSVARDLYASRGFDAVMRFNPAPFWAAVCWSEIPLVLHGDSELVFHSIEGEARSADLETLGEGWTREKSGRHLKFTFNENDFFDSLVVYCDERTGKALAVARNAPAFERLLAALGSRFKATAKEPERMHALMQAICQEVLGAELKETSWDRPFNRRSDRVKGRAGGTPGPSENTGGGSADSAVSKLNAALPLLMESVNSGSEPDWDFVARRFSLDPSDVETLKSLYGQVKSKLGR